MFYKTCRKNIFLKVNTVGMMESDTKGIYKIHYAKYRRGTHKYEDVKLICKNWNHTYFGCEKNGNFCLSISAS